MLQASGPLDIVQAVLAGVDVIDTDYPVQILCPLLKLPCTLVRARHMIAVGADHTRTRLVPALLAAFESRGRSRMQMACQLSDLSAHNGCRVTRLRLR